MSSKRVTITTQEDMLLIGGLLEAKSQELEERCTKPFLDSDEMLGHASDVQHVNNMIARFDEALNEVIPVDEPLQIVNEASSTGNKNTTAIHTTNKENVNE